MWDWISCIIDTQGDKNACISKAAKYMPPEDELFVVLGFLIGAGTCCILFLFRLSMIQGWYHVITGKVQRYPESVLLDGRRKHAQRQGYQETGGSLGGITVSTSTYVGHSDIEEPPLVYKEFMKGHRIWLALMRFPKIQLVQYLHLFRFNWVEVYRLKPTTV